MKIHKPDTCLLLQNYHVLAKQPMLLISLGFVVNSDGSLLDEQKAWPWLLEQFKNQPFDLGFKKLCGTFAVMGEAHAQGTTQPLLVTARMGTVEKSLYVFGDRYWEQGLTGWSISSPQPFSTMPVNATHAFGGSDNPSNPLGKGDVKRGKAIYVGAPLPNLELVDSLIHSPQDQPPAAHLGLLPLTALEKQKWLGAVDQQWQQHDFPWLPQGTHDRWFDAVPEDQTQEPYWVGNESWSVTGMHPEKERVQCSLPSLCPHLLLNTHQTDVPTEIQLVLDTVWLAPNDERSVLWYRAAVPVLREDGADIKQLAVFIEPVKQSSEYLHAAWLDLSESDQSDVGSNELGAQEDASPEIKAEAVEFAQSLNDDVMADLASAHEQMNQQLLEAGLGELHVELQSNQGLLGVKQSEPKWNAEQFKADIHLDIKESLAEGQQLMNEQLDRVEQELGVEKGQLKTGSSLFQENDEFAEAELFLARLPFEAQKKEAMARFGAFKQQLQQMDQRFAALAPLVPVTNPEPKALTSVLDIQELLQQGQSLVGQELKGLTLTNECLDGMDLSGTYWQACCFVGVSLRETNLSQALFEKCEFKACDLQYSNWRGADIKQSHFQKVDWRFAEMSQAIFTETQLEQVQWEHSTVSGGLFEQCELKAVSFEHATLIKTTFFQTQARGTLFRQANLTDLRVDLECDLSYSQFNQAILEGASWQDSTLQHVCFSQATLQRSFFRNCDLSHSQAVLMQAQQASFIECDLRYSSWQGANLMESSFAHMSLDMVNWDGINAYGLEARTAKIIGVSLLGALLTRSSLQEREGV